MINASIRETLKEVRTQLAALTDTTHIIYDVQPLVKILKDISILIERNGVPEFDVEKIVNTEGATTRYFNDMTSKLYRILLIVSKIIDELTERINESLEKYTTKINTIEPAIEDLRQRIADIESQTLEKISNTAIYEHEVKEVNFSRNINSNDFTVINNILLLPVQEHTRIIANDIGLSILGSDNATNRLDGKITSTDDKTDAETITGTYFGDMVGLLDGSDSFTSEDDFDINSLYNNNINQILNANFYSTNPTDKLEIEINNILNATRKVNFIQVATNTPANAYYSVGREKTKVELKHGIFAYPIDVKELSFTIQQQIPERKIYQGINVIDKDTSTIVKRHNYFNSMNYLFPDTLKYLNPDIETSDISVTPSQTIQIAERYGLYKYHIDVSSIDLYINSYELTGTLITDKLTTESDIESVEIEVEQFVPTEEIEHITYEISFDNTTWYPIRPRNVGITKFNNTKKRRIVLNNDNNDPEFLFIGEQTTRNGVYLRITMNSNDAYITPVIYNVKLKIKVE